MGDTRRSSASPRPPCDGTPSASVWPSPRQTPGPSCPYPSEIRPPDATMKRVGAPSAWFSHSDLDKKESDGRDPPQGVAPHAHEDVIGARERFAHLVIIIVSVEEWLLSEDHTREHTPQTPHIQRIVVHLNTQTFS